MVALALPHISSCATFCLGYELNNREKSMWVMHQCISPLATLCIFVWYFYEQLIFKQYGKNKRSVRTTLG